MLDNIKRFRPHTSHGFDVSLMLLILHIAAGILMIIPYARYGAWLLPLVFLLIENRLSSPCSSGSDEPKPFLRRSTGRRFFRFPDHDPLVSDRCFDPDPDSDRGMACEKLYPDPCSLGRQLG